MKVLLLNGSPRKNGCTYTALNVVADALKAEGIDAEVFQAGDPDMENVKAAAAKRPDHRIYGPSGICSRKRYAL